MWPCVMDPERGPSNVIVPCLVQALTQSDKGTRFEVGNMFLKIKKSET
jgi:hypothetical protein